MSHPVKTCPHCGEPTSRLVTHINRDCKKRRQRKGGKPKTFKPNSKSLGFRTPITGRRNI